VLRHSRPASLAVFRVTFHVAGDEQVQFAVVVCRKILLKPTRPPAALPHLGPSNVVKVPLPLFMVENFFRKLVT